MRGRDAGLVVGVNARRTRSASGHLDVAVDTVVGLKGLVDEDARLRALYAAFKTLSGGQ